MLVGLAHAPDQGGAPGRSAQSLEAAAVHGKGVHPRVRVVGVQHDQPDAVVEEGAVGEVSSTVPRPGGHPRPQQLDPGQPRNPAQAQHAHEIAPVHPSFSFPALPARRMRPSRTGSTVPHSFRYSTKAARIRMSRSSRAPGSTSHGTLQSPPPLTR